MNLYRIFKSKTTVFLIFLTFLLVPSIFDLFRPGIFFMHDFHPFRLYEYDKCLKDYQFPCRWAPDAAFEYGQPLFNFYTQMPYLFGEVFLILGFSILDSIKILLGLSLILSGIAMFFLSKQIWRGNTIALISALVYIYAPYRAVDIYVRAALPEAIAFVYFPLIVLFFNKYILTKKIKFLLWFSLFFALLVLTHNLSAFMFLIFLFFWSAYFIYINKAYSLIPKFSVAGILIFFLCAFYILPLLFESHLISLNETTRDYYEYGQHFVTLKQLLISRYFGYGSSFWGEDDRLSLSIGQMQWILPLALLTLLILRKKITKYPIFVIFFLSGWFFLFLTHGKSNFLWSILPPLSFVQFPWRFLGLAVFSFAISLGAISLLFKGNRSKLTALIFIFSTLLILNISFFKGSEWKNYDDQSFFQGANYQKQISSAVKDFWPKYGSEYPTKIAPKNIIISEGSGSGKLLAKNSNQAIYKMDLKSPTAIISIPIVYFPGWQMYSNQKELNIYPSGELGLITASINRTDQELFLKFIDTPIRKLANFLTAVGLILLFGFFIYAYRNEKN